MEQVELDVALEELETRLERLRALYEQYFLGLEKIEPAVARKDVDRRIYVLRREKIRNTAKRFKLQTIIQRYNTFQQYWQRICREIENGTYKRHLLRAQKGNDNLLTIAARRRLGRGARTSQAPEAAPTSQPPSAPPAAAPEPVAAPAAGKPAAPQPAAMAPPVATVAATPAAAAPPKPPAKAPPPKPAPQKFESLDLDMDFMGDWDPAASRRSAPSSPAAAKAAPAPPRAPAPASAPAPSPHVAKLAPVPAPAPTPAAARPASIPPQPVAVPPRPASSRPPRPPAHPIVASPRIPASPRVAPPQPAASSPIAAASPKPAAAPAKPAGAAAPAKPTPAAAPPAPKPAAAAAGVDDARLRDLHSKLQQAKQQTKEANVSFEGLAKSIRATEAKLREQHKNRKIEFDVVIKDGKAVVKPIVR